MSKIPKELLKNYVNEQDFKNPNGVLNAMKDMFKDVLQEVLEVEMDLHLAYGKNDLSEGNTNKLLHIYKQTDGLTKYFKILLFKSLNHVAF